MNLASVIIPVFNHGQYVAEAVQSALHQTVPVDVIVVDDGSTDDTAKVIRQFNGHVRSERIDHGGPSAARNRGLEMAETDYVMFLDADDVIAPGKIERQLDVFDDHVGFVLCDVLIEDGVRNKTETASQRYRYPQRNLGGWVREQLAPANFIPIMAPLVRRAVLGDEIRFGDLLPEDWHFWYAVAGVARMRYLPEVLATYRKRRGGRNTQRVGVIHTSPIAAETGVRVLNLGCGTPGTPSWHPMPGAVNLDKSMGWCFEDGLVQYTEPVVDAITVSHAAMYIHEDDWPFVFSEFARVLKPGGVIRITEDATDDPQSRTYPHGWKGSEPAVTLTSAAKVIAALEAAGLRAREVREDETLRPDLDLRQAQHGEPPDVFFVEGVK